MAEVIVRRATEDEQRACFAVRHDVFVVGQNVPANLELDGLDDRCTHFVALVDGRVVGTARLRIVDQTAKAERVAVRAEARGSGLGHRLMDALEAEARRLGHTEVVLSAQKQVISFYAQRGYVADGPIYVEAGIDHQKMRRRWPDP